MKEDMDLANVYWDFGENESRIGYFLIITHFTIIIKEPLQRIPIGVHSFEAFDDANR